MNGSECTEWLHYLYSKKFSKKFSRLTRLSVELNPGVTACISLYQSVHGSAMLSQGHRYATDLQQGLRLLLSGKGEPQSRERYLISFDKICHSVIVL